MYDEEYQKRRAFWRITFWTFSFLAILTGLNALFIVNSLGRGLFKPLTRTVASVPTEVQAKIEMPVPPLIEVNCAKKSPIQLATRASSTRLMFKNCKAIERVVNVSNLAKGDIFPLDNKHWTSDFISLKLGENLIKAKIGDHTQIININRETSKKPTDDKAL